jgi:mono/diheme cytochrome c family protein
MKKQAAFLFASMAASGLANSQEAKRDPVTAGHDFALKVCAACHVVANDQQSPPMLKPPAPSFSKIVKNPGFSEQSLRQLLSSPHGNLGKNGKMPNPQLAEYQIDEVVAYLLELKRRR